MKNKQISLEEVRENLLEIVKPYQRQHTQRQRMIDSIRLCIRNVDRDDFFQLDEMLKTKTINDIEQEEGLQSYGPLFKRLRSYAEEKVDLYRVQFVDEFKKYAREADLPIEVDFPRFTVLKGIEGQIEFATRKTLINKKPLKSIDPKRIVTAALKLKRLLYDKPYDAQSFINNMFQVYKEILKKNKKSVGDTVPIQQFYLAYVLAMQSSVFFQDMDKGKFRGYSLDQFAVDIWRYFQAGIKGTSDRYALKLSPGRSKLWLIDSDGEKRQINAISFHRKK